MPQEPDIDISKIETIKELPMPVPRRTEVRPAENIKPNSDEVFGNTGPDSGFALKIVSSSRSSSTIKILLLFPFFGLPVMILF